MTPSFRSLASILTIGAVLAGCGKPEDELEHPGVSGLRSGDALLTCPQIVSEIERENAVIKREGQIAAQQTGATALFSTHQDPGAKSSNFDPEDLAVDPGSQDETPAQKQANAVGGGAHARAEALVDLGRQKNCFQ